MVLRAVFYSHLTIPSMDYALGLFSEERDHGVKKRVAGGREGEAHHLSQPLSIHKDLAVDRNVFLVSYPVNVCTSHEE